jgi:hypothetical protein
MGNLQIDFITLHAMKRFKIVNGMMEIHKEILPGLLLGLEWTLFWQPALYSLPGFIFG